MSIEKQPLTNEHGRDKVQCLLGNVAVDPLNGSVYDGLNEMGTRNVDVLQKSGPIGEHLVPFYLAAIDEEPGLQWTILKPETVNNDKSLRHSPGISEEIGDLDHQVTIAVGDWKIYEKVLKSRHKTVAIMAEKLGIPGTEFDQKMIAAHILLHELGHVVDYSQNLPPQQAQERAKQDRAEMQALPVANKHPGELISYLKGVKGRVYWAKHKQAFEARGIYSRKELVEAQETAYRATRAETAPDEFAAKILRRVLTPDRSTSNFKKH